MSCRICGDENNTKYYATKRQTLCRSCSKHTPAKVSRVVFDSEYWWNAEAQQLEHAPESTKREFYQDYLSSGHASVKSYAEATTSSI